MTTIGCSTRVLTAPEAVEAFISDVVQAADSDRDALGFFPGSVYSDYRRKGQLYVAVMQSGDTTTYAGHLLFSLNFPKAHVRQIYVPTSQRGKRIGQLLLATLKAQLAEGQFMSIHARVAEDLKDANAFWESQDFYPQRVEMGGATRNRQIVVRAHELNTPQLFASSGINAADPLGLDSADDMAKPLYLLDLNVLFDLGPRRPRHDLALSVFRAERMQTCSLAVSSEIETELARTAHDGKTDPMLFFAGTLAKFPIPPDEEWERLAPTLAGLVFPDRQATNSLTPNDRSDLMHLATAIHHGLSGIITSDGRILDRALELRRRFGIDAISPEFFQAEPNYTEASAIQAACSTDTIELQTAASSDASEVRKLLSDLDIATATQVNEWAATEAGSSACQRFIAQRNGSVAGYLVLPTTAGSSDIRAHMAVREDQPGSHEVAQAMLRHVMGMVKPADLARVRLSLPPRQASLREEAGMLGFVATPGSTNDLQKIVVKMHLTARNWSSGREMLACMGKVGLPAEPPAFRHIDQQVPIVRPDGQRALVSWLKLESLLAPLLLCLPSRRGVMVPIRKEFEEHLLADSPQESLLPQGKAQLAPLRHYLSDKKTLKNFSRGDLLFFYEPLRNKGAGAVIAVGRVLRAYLREESAMQMSDLAPSVLNGDQLSSIGSSRIKTITVFDNVLRLRRPVPLPMLRSLRCGEAHQLISSQRLSSEQVQAILDKGL